MKILGLDVGQKRIGVAMSEGSLVSSYGVIQNSDRMAAILAIAKICNLEKVEKIVIGIPKNKDTFQADTIHYFALELTKNINLPIIYADETLTSGEAERQLKKSDFKVGTEKYKEEIDKISAKLILEQYLNASRRK